MVPAHLGMVPVPPKMNAVERIQIYWSFYKIWWKTNNNKL